MTDRTSQPAKVPSKSPSDAQGSEFKEQRENFIHTFFRKGAELTEEILKENERLRSRVNELEADNTMLRSQVESDTALRQFLVTIERLEAEKKELLSRVHRVTDNSSVFIERLNEIENENAKLANLYVASYQLHSTLSMSGVVRHIKELLMQFVGAEAFALFLVDEKSQRLVPVASEGVQLPLLQPIALGEGEIGQSALQGNTTWIETDTSQGSREHPAACIPLRIEEHIVGVIAVFSTFEQKPAFNDVDFELFRLLGTHAASALAAARLFKLYGPSMNVLSNSLEAFANVER